MGVAHGFLALPSCLEVSGGAAYENLMIEKTLKLFFPAGNLQEERLVLSVTEARAPWPPWGH